MHKYLKAIGYGNITTEKQLNKLLEEIEDEYSFDESVQVENELEFGEIKRVCKNQMGISVCGIKENESTFIRQYYYPYFKGSGETSDADITVERHIDREAYVGICEDEKIGISLIFHLHNTIEYLTKRKTDGHEPDYRSVTLAGLCNEGKILFPVMKNEELKQKSKEESKNRMMLLNAARNGDQAAMESLTLDDIDIYSKVSRRLITEDVFSIVDTYFMPCGIECDLYSILGEILSIHIVQNEYTDEQIYIMYLNVNELQFDVCVPVREVIGEPEVGRRFKGEIWLQGIINF